MRWKCKDENSISWWNDGIVLRVLFWEPFNLFATQIIVDNISHFVSVQNEIPPEEMFGRRQIRRMATWCANIRCMPNCQTQKCFRFTKPNDFSRDALNIILFQSLSVIYANGLKSWSNIFIAFVRSLNVVATSICFKSFTPFCTATCWIGIVLSKYMIWVDIGVCTCTPNPICRYLITKKPTFLLSTSLFRLFVTNVQIFIVWTPNNASEVEVEVEVDPI